MKVAFTYDRVNKFGGAERVLLALHEIFPEAPLYTSVYNPKTAPWAKVFPRIYTSFLQNIPFAKNNHEFFAPLMPLAFSRFNFNNYDLVISVTSEFAKNLPRRKAGINTGYKHICYCLTPTRYLWSHSNQYLTSPFSILTSPLIYLLKKIDYRAAQKPDVMIAISKEVQTRIKKYYERESIVIYPPVEKLKNSKNLKLQANSNIKYKNYYLVVSRLVKYKRVDLAIKAFNQLRLPLVIVGTGREEKHLKKNSQ